MRQMRRVDGGARCGGMAGCVPGENMKTIVMRCSGWRILDFGSGPIRRGSSVRRKKSNQLQDLTLRAGLRHAIVPGNGFGKSGGDVKEPCVAQLRRSSHVDSSYSGKGKMLEKGVEVTTQSAKGLRHAGENILAFGRRITRFLIVLTKFRSTARL